MEYNGYSNLHICVSLRVDFCHIFFLLSFLTFVLSLCILKLKGSYSKIQCLTVNIDFLSQYPLGVERCRII